MLNMRGGLFQYVGIHDFVSALSMPNPLVNRAGNQSFDQCNSLLAQYRSAIEAAEYKVEE